VNSISASLRGLAVLDLGAGLAPAIVAKLLARFGAVVRRLEPARGDAFYGVYPGYAQFHARASIERVQCLEAPRVEELLGDVDIVLLGGEDFPGYVWRLDAEALAARHPRLFILDITAYPDPESGPAVDHLVQARSGTSYEHYSERPLRSGFEAASYGAALQGLFGLLGIVYCGRGQVVRTSYYEGALTWVVPMWSRASAPGPAFPAVLPKDPVPLIFRCRDGRYIHFVIGSAGSKYNVYHCLGIDDSTVKEGDSGQPTGKEEHRKIFGDVDLLAPYVAKMNSANLLEDLQRAGVAAELVADPGACWDDPQVKWANLIDTAADGTRSAGLSVTGTLIDDGRGEPLRNAPSNEGPLAGIRVLDFGLFVAGPFGPCCLGDLGADVIKVEPMDGDVNRRMFKSFASSNRGKRSIAIDMKTPEGRELVQRLCDSADVLENNFRPGVSERLGIGPATVHGRDRSKIVLESTGYGREGPKRHLAGFDMALQAFCGLEARAGGIGNVPLWTRSTMIDYATGMLGAIAVLAALCARRLGNGGGADLQATLLGTGIFLLSELVQTSDGRFIGAPPLNHEQTGFHPAEAFYQAVDGWIAIAARTEEMAARLTAVLGIQLPPRAEWGPAETERIAGVIRPRSVKGWLTAFAAADVWAEPCVRDGDEYLVDPERHPRSIVAEYHSHAHGIVRQPGALFRLSRDRVGAPGIVPQLGEHTRGILLELGYSASRITELQAMKIID
jgi:crotonobetainyl-CoA:carnitine CoA-transferase CaiB-like acyl-CoA transferase